MRVHKFAQAAVAAASLVAASFLIAPPAHAYSQTQARVVATRGIGVGCRTAPYGAADCGYGAPESRPNDNLTGVVTLGCFFRYGDPVGSNGNDLWWRVTYGGKTFFVADHWLDTPAPVNHSPAWYN